MANISWMISGEPFSEQFQDFYFSTDGGLRETEYVFLKQNGFPERFENLKSESSDSSFSIAETGFGTGLNFLVTAYHWLQESDLECVLEYTAVEKYPLSHSQMKQVYETFIKTWPQLSDCCTELLQSYSDKPAHQEMTLFNGKIMLNLIIADATEGLKQLLPSQQKINAWYLDGFAPAKNPDMWNMELFKTIAKLSQSGTTLSTFTSAGVVRRGLIEVGFEMTKVPGLGKKREILSGVLLERE